MLPHPTHDSKDQVVSLDFHPGQTMMRCPNPLAAVVSEKSSTELDPSFPLDDKEAQLSTVWRQCGKPGLPPLPVSKEVPLHSAGVISVEG